MIELVGVSKHYITASRRVMALSNVSLQLPARGMVCFLGQSGSGKSTLLDVIGGVSEPTEGSILWDGKAEQSQFRDAIGYLFQDAGLFPFLTARENVALACDEKEMVSFLLESVGMTEFAERMVRTLSGGEQQRVAVARMLASSPKVVIADEPTGALDLENSRAIFELLKAIAREKLVLVATHDRENAEHFADALYEINAGKVAPLRLDGSAEVQAIGRTFPVFPKEGSVQGVHVGGMEVCFSLRHMKANALRNILFCIILALLLGFGTIGVSILSCRARDIAWRYITSHDIAMISFSHWNGSALTADEMSYLDGVADCLWVSQEVGYVRDVRAFAPLIKGDTDGAVAFGEDYAIGDAVTIGGAQYRVSGIVREEGLSVQQLAMLPPLIVSVDCYVQAAERVVVRTRSLTKEEIAVLLEEYGLWMTVDWQFDRYERWVEIGEYIRSVCDEIDRLKPIVLLLTVVVTLVAVVHCVWFVMRSVHKEYRTVGILKSLGKRDASICGIFALQIGILFAVALGLGALGTVGGLYFFNWGFAFREGIEMISVAANAWCALPAVAILSVLAIAFLIVFHLIRNMQMAALLRSLNV